MLHSHAVQTRMVSYFIWSVTLWKVALSLVPRPSTTAMIAMEIPSLGPHNRQALAAHSPLPYIVVCDRCTETPP